MMQGRRNLAVAWWFIVVVLCVPLVQAQQIRFTDFSSVSQLQFNGAATTGSWPTPSNIVLRLTDGPQGLNTPRSESSSVYFTTAQPVSKGFYTYFSFQMHNPVTFAGYGEGFAFVVQNAPSTDATMGATGSGLTSLGSAQDPNGFSGLGYAGIKNSLAIEFDVHKDAWDPSANHVAVQSCGQGTNTPVHIAGNFTIYNNTNVTSCLLPNSLKTAIPRLAGKCNTTPCTNGAVHQVVIQYTPPTTGPSGTLQVWIDPQFISGTHTPKLTSHPQVNIPYTIDDPSTGLSLIPDPSGVGRAYVGFTGSQSDLDATQDILAWEFTPQTPVSVTQQLMNGPAVNKFVYGGHETTFQYPDQFNVGTIYMTILATPWDRQTFFNQRLAGTPFANQTCIQYLEVNACIVYTVSCQAMPGGPGPNNPDIPCPPTGIPNINVVAKYYTADNETPTTAAYLKAEDGGNAWMNICNPVNGNPPCLQLNVFDNQHSGTVPTPTSPTADYVATFCPTGNGCNSSPAALPKKNESGKQ